MYIVHISFENVPIPPPLLFWRTFAMSLQYSQKYVYVCVVTTFYCDSLAK